MTDAPRDTCVICGVPETPSVAFEKGYADGYKRGLEDAAKAAAEECDCAYAARAIRAKIQEGGDEET